MGVLGTTFNIDVDVPAACRSDCNVEDGRPLVDRRFYGVNLARLLRQRLCDDSGKAHPRALYEGQMIGGASDVLDVSEDLLFGPPFWLSRVSAQLSQHVVLGVGTDAGLGGVDAERK